MPRQVAHAGRRRARVPERGTGGILVPLLILFVLGGVARALAGNVTGTKHDLSTAGTDEPCVFCHTPHQASTAINVPLWNRTIGIVTFTPYTSSTMDTMPANPPNAYSIACLGCHDGTLAYDANGIGDKHDLLNAPGSDGIPDTSSWPNCERCHPEYYGGDPVQWFGLDLRDDHPISMDYPASDPDFAPPPDPLQGWGTGSPNDVKLYGGKIECPSCHNVHDSTYSPFLRKSNAASAVCLTCHLK